MSNPSIPLIHEQITLNGAPFHYFRPANDNTVYGTLSCIQSGKFHLDKVTPFADGEVFIDIGCNVGLLSMIVGFLYPQARIFSFDASARAIEALRRGCAANGITNVQSFHLAVGAKNQSNVKFFSNGSDLSCLVEDGLNKSNKVEDVVVNKVAFSELFDSPLLGVDRVRFLKMDIEGGEFEIFNHVYADRGDLLNRIEFLHLEIHQYEEFNPAQLTQRITDTFGERVIFDT